MGTRIALVVIGTALVATAAVIAARYHSDLDSARVRVAGSSMAATPCGRIEYSDRGKGPTVLVVQAEVVETVTQFLRSNR